MSANSWIVSEVVLVFDFFIVLGGERERYVRRSSEPLVAK